MRPRIFVCKTCHKEIDRTVPQSSNSYCNDSCRGRAVLSRERNLPRVVPAEDEDSGNYFDNFVDGAGY